MARNRNATLWLEPLESRQLMAADFRNPANGFDVDNSGLVQPLDALLVINDLNANGIREMGAKPAGYTGPLCDVNGDGVIAPLDALQILNALNRFKDPITLQVRLNAASDLNQNGVVQKAEVTYEGLTLPESKIKLEPYAGTNASLTAETTADANGRFELRLTLPEGMHELKFRATDVLGRSIESSRQVQRGDVTVDWNAELLKVVRESSTTLPDGSLAKPPPPLVARNMAMVHAAMFDAINAVAKTYESYGAAVAAQPDASPVAAAAVAAHRVSSQVFSQSAELVEWNDTLTEAMSSIPDGPAKTAGIVLGEQIASAILSLRANDGSQLTSLYSPGSEPGDWNPTFPNFQAPILPQWPNVKPFTLDVGSQFRPAAPPALGSAEYANAVDEVMRLGSSDSTQRTADQTEIARFWADGGGTATPPGHWNLIATGIALDAGQSLLENARMYALLNLALADAGITAWDAKYLYDLWRPIDAIRQADRDGNSATQPQSGWTPLLPTPPFPTYTSGHSTFSAAAAEVLTELFGDNVAFTTRVDGGSTGQWPPIDDISQLSVRSFENFREAAAEAGRSRVYGGIHFEFDNQAGLSSGKSVGQWVVNNFLRSKSEIGQRIANQVMPEVGDVAPPIKLLNQRAEEIDVTDFIGQKAVVLYFYPKDDTPGCTVQAQDFRDRAAEIEALGGKVFGISLDDVTSHRAFSDKFNLNFSILADTTTDVTTAYGVLGQVNDNLIAKRTTFIVGKDGLIKEIFKDVDVNGHGLEVVEALRKFV